MSARMCFKAALVIILSGCFLASTTFSALISTSVISNNGTILQVNATHLALSVDGFNLLDSAGNKVHLRGVGVAGVAPDLIFWGTSGGDNWGDQWQPADSLSVTQTFQNLRDVWHVNMIRFFMYPEWWWQDIINPNELSGWSMTSFSTRSYLKTLASVAADYGIYLDIVPLALTAQDRSFNGDPYLSDNNGLPMMNSWDTAQTAFIQSTGLSEQEFWSQFWASMATEFMSYPNVIFEAWNEPSVSGSEYVNVIPSNYLTYLTTMYSGIRGTGSSNLIMMQWGLGTMPNWWDGDLRWCSQIANAIGNPTNLVYTTHFYYYAPTDITGHWNQKVGNDSMVSNSEGGIPLTVTQLETFLNAIIDGGTDSKGWSYQGMGVTAPLIINEEGTCLASSSNKTNDYLWWANLLQAQANLGIGMGAYYWLSDTGLGGTYAGETLMSTGYEYTPNTMGQEYIDVYG